MRHSLTKHPNIRLDKYQTKSDDIHSVLGKGGEREGGGSILTSHFPNQTVCKVKQAIIQVACVRIPYTLARAIITKIPQGQGLNKVQTVLAYKLHSKL